MSRTPLIVALALGLLMTGVASSVAMAQAQADKGIIIVDFDFIGKIAGIKGNTVTVRSDKGVEHVFELASASSLKVGATAKCEGKGCQKLQVSGKSIKVNRIAK